MHIVAMLIVTLGVGACVPGGATEGTTAPRLLGFVDIPALFGVWDWDTQTLRVPPSGPVSLYAEHDSPVVLELVATPEELETREFEYERDGAVVYAIARDAFKLRLSDGSYGWIRAREAGTFHSLESRLVDGLTYLTLSWDKAIYAAPGGSARPLSVSISSENIPVDVIEAREHDGALWVLVDVLSSICEADPGTIVDRGWIAVHSAKGDPNVWFYSRGC